MVFHWNLSDSKSFQVSRTLFSVLTDLDNAVVGIISIRPTIFNYYYYYYYYKAGSKISKSSYVFMEF